MPAILDLFNQKTVLSYVKARQYQQYIGDSLFPARPVDSLDIEILEDTTSTPVIAPMSAFDTEAQIGSREANKRASELGYIKRKIGLKEKDLIGLRNPRTPEEQQYLMQQVFNDTDSMVQGVLARVELMRMQLLSSGIVEPDDKNVQWKLDYQIADDHKITVKTPWDDPTADVINDMFDWADEFDSNPTKILTSRKIVRSLLKNEGLKSYFKSVGQIPSIANLNNYLEGQGLPIIVENNLKYRVQGTDGKYTSERFFPEDKFVLFNDDTCGHTAFGPTPEQSHLLTDNSLNSMVGNVFATMYEEGHDPVGTWTKASATALPTLANPHELVQSTVLLSK